LNIRLIKKYVIIWKKNFDFDKQINSKDQNFVFETNQDDWSVKLKWMKRLFSDKIQKTLLSGFDWGKPYSYSWINFWKFY
jgi:hypothetical protein